MRRACGARAFRERSSPRRRPARRLATSTAGAPSAARNARGLERLGLPRRMRSGARWPRARRGGPRDRAGLEQDAHQARAMAGRVPGSGAASSARRIAGQAARGPSVEHVEVAGEASAVTAAALNAGPASSERPRSAGARSSSSPRSSASSAREHERGRRAGRVAGLGGERQRGVARAPGRGRVAEEPERVGQAAQADDLRVQAVAQRGGSARCSGAVTRPTAASKWRRAAASSPCQNADDAQHVVRSPRAARRRRRPRRGRAAARRSAARLEVAAGQAGEGERAQQRRARRGAASASARSMQLGQAGRPIALDDGQRREQRGDRARSSSRRARAPACRAPARACRTRVGVGVHAQRRAGRPLVPAHAPRRRPGAVVVQASSRSPAPGRRVQRARAPAPRAGAVRRRRAGPSAP